MLKDFGSLNVDVRYISGEMERDNEIGGTHISTFLFLEVSFRLQLGVIGGFAS